MTVEKEFRVNNYITLKLKGIKTTIYVAGEPFDQCKHLLLNIPVDQVESYEEIDSIDAAAEKLGSNDIGQLGRSYEILPLTEFWGHCSNIQAWAENNYDTRILHRTLAFPLLKKLTDCGDPIAKRVFKEEIAKRFESGHSTVVQYLIQNRYLEYLDNAEILVVITNILNDTKKLEENYRPIYSILKKLADNGNITAKQMFKDQIINRFENGYPAIIQYLNNKKCLDYLSREEVLGMIRNTIKDLKKLKENYSSIYSVLKKLIEEGDLTARQIFKEELIERFKNGQTTLIQYLINGKFLKYLTDEEALIILMQILNNPNQFNKNYFFLYRFFKRLTDVACPNVNGDLKRELFKILKEGSPCVVKYLMEQGYIHYLDKKEFLLLENTLSINKKVKKVRNKSISSGDHTLDGLLFGGFRQGLIYLLYGDNKIINNILLNTSVIVQKSLSKGGMGEAIRLALIYGDNSINPYKISMTTIQHNLYPHRALENIFLRRVIKWNQMIDILKNKLSYFIDLKLVLISDISMLINNHKKLRFEELLKTIKKIKNTRWRSNPTIIMLAPIDDYYFIESIKSDQITNSGIVIIKIEDDKNNVNYTLEQHPKFPESKLSNLINPIL
ncbi:MAG: hypothetical protein ACFFBI_06265 [Promethearchaeota archaeon]